MADSQPPEGLQRKIAEKLAAANPYDLDWPLPQSACNCGECCERVTGAVLAALFEACEVRERWGTRWTYADGEVRTAWWTDRDEAEHERDWPTPASAVELIHRCDLKTPVEVITAEVIRPPVSSTGEEKTDGN